MKRALVVLAILILPSLALCQEDPAERNNLHLGLMWGIPQGDPKVTIGGARSRVEIDNDTGYYLDYEIKFTDVIGLEFGAAWIEYDVDLSSGPFQGALGKLKVKPFTANLLFHPNAKAPVDFYIGGGFAYVAFSDLRVKPPLRGVLGEDQIGLDKDKTFNVQTGVNIKFGDSHAGLNFDAKYIKATADADVGEFKVDPIHLGAALLIRW